MKQAKIGDKAQVMALLVASFEKNMRMLPYREYFEALIAYAFDYCYHFGGVYLSENGNGCALLYYPDQKKISIRGTWLKCKLICKTGRHYSLVRPFIRQSFPHIKDECRPVSCLCIIGIAPQKGRQGIGTKLLKELIAHAETQNRVLYAGASTLNNLPWYERIGFVTDERGIIAPPLPKHEFLPIAV